MLLRTETIMTTIPTPIRLAGASALVLALTACMDVSMTVDITSEAEAEITSVTSMTADIYAMIEGAAEAGDEGFCDDGETIERGDVIDCVVTHSGTFDALDLSGEDGGPLIEAIGNGQVRVAFPTGEIAESIAQDAGADEDPQMRAMIAAMFEGHFITMTVTGGPILDTNMEIAADGRSASFQVPFTDLFEGDLDLPEEIFAVVQK